MLERVEVTEASPAQVAAVDVALIDQTLRLYSLWDVAQLLSAPYESVRRWLRDPDSGLAYTHTLPGGRKRIAARALLAYETACALEVARGR